MTKIQRPNIHQPNTTGSGENIEQLLVSGYRRDNDNSFVGNIAQWKTNLHTLAT
jgi:hypothetical protein